MARYQSTANTTCPVPFLYVGDESQLRSQKIICPLAYHTENYSQLQAIDQGTPPNVIEQNYIINQCGVILKKIQFDKFLVIFKLELEVIVDVVHVVLCFQETTVSVLRRSEFKITLKRFIL